MIRYVSLALPVLAIMAVIIGIGMNAGQTRADETEDGHIYVVTTTSHIADLVENLNPGHIKVTSLMGTGVDPHLFKPAASDILKLKNADIIFFNGLHLEGQMGELLEEMAHEKPVLALADYLKGVNFLESDTASLDPHIWMDVALWRQCALAAAALLKQHDPENGDVYDQKLQRYDARLENLERYVQTSIASIPARQRTLITAHDAFGYFGQAYGVEVIGIQGLSTESEAGLKRMRDISTLITGKKVATVFAETSVSSRNIEALIQHTQDKGFQVKLGSTLYSDSLGAEGSDESTYIGMMVFNTRAIVSGLGGIATAFIEPRFPQTTQSL